MHVPDLARHEKCRLSFDLMKQKWNKKEDLLNINQLSLLLCRDEATRTPDPYVPNVVRYQLRYIPIASDFRKIACKGSVNF